MLRRFAIIGTLVVMVGPPVTARAGEVPPCSFDPETGLVEVVLPVQTWPFVPIVIGRLGDAIAIDGQPCADATVTNTDTISVTGEAEPEEASHVIDIDLSGGPFAPGRTPEPDGSSQIEITVDAGPSAGDQVQIVGGAEADVLTIDVSAVTLGADRDAVPDLRLLGMEDTECGGGSSCWTDELRIDTGAGPDRLFLRPDPVGSIQLGLVLMGPGRDHVSADHAVIYGGQGDDVMRTAGSARLMGWSGDDRLVAMPGTLSSYLAGETGRDLLIGASSGQWMVGGPNADILKGRGGGDTLYGGDARDLLIGGPGSDALDGGAGRDRCDMDPDDSSHSFCERVARA